MTVHSVRLWGHSKHLVSSVMSPAGDRPPEVLGLGSRSAQAPAPTSMSQLPGQAPVSCLELRPPRPARHHMRQTHAHARTHTLPTQTTEPTASLCVVTMKHATPNNDPFGCRALRGSDAQHQAQEHSATDGHTFISFGNLVLCSCGYCLCLKRCTEKSHRLEATRQFTPLRTTSQQALRSPREGAKSEGRSPGDSPPAWIAAEGEANFPNWRAKRGVVSPANESDSLQPPAAHLRAICTSHLPGLCFLLLAS